MVAAEVRRRCLSERATAAAPQPPLVYVGDTQRAVTGYRNMLVGIV